MLRPNLPSCHPRVAIWGCLGSLAANGQPVSRLACWRTQAVSKGRTPCQEWREPKSFEAGLRFHSLEIFPPCALFYWACSEELSLKILFQKVALLRVGTCRSSRRGPRCKSMPLASRLVGCWMGAGWALAGCLAEVLRRSGGEWCMGSGVGLGSDGVARANRLQNLHANPIQTQIQTSTGDSREVQRFQTA